LQAKRGPPALGRRPHEIQPPELWPETQPVKGQENVRQAFQAVVETSNDLPSMRVLELTWIVPRPSRRQG